MKKKIQIVLVVLMVSAFAKAYSQQITGTWKTIDDKTGEVKSHVQIYQKDDEFYGKIVKILDPDAPKDATCQDCEGELAGKPIMGLEILRGIEKDGKYYEDGKITDPENGKDYKCKLWLEENDPNTLNVRGYVLFFHRTQQWERVE
jgi:uncharacterized protein (DUF2147 family)